MDAQVVDVEDRRLFDRFVTRFPVRIQNGRDDYGATISLRNASAQGIKVTSRKQLYLDDAVTLEVELPDCREPMTLKGQVVWVGRDETGAWDVGIRFYKIDLVHLARLFKFVYPSAV